MPRSYTLLMLAAAGCAGSPADSASPATKYLYVWAGPHAESVAMAPAEGPADFVAVIDADTASSTYGQVLTSVGTGTPGAMAHHIEFTFPAGRSLFVDDFGAGRVFLLDFTDPLAPRVARRIDSVPGYRRPHSFVRLPNGHVLASLQFGNGSVAGDPGGVAEFDAAGELLRTGSSRDSAFPGAHIRTYAIEAFPAIDRLVTTSSPMDNETTADVIQVWRLSDLTLLKTVAVPRVAGDSAEKYPFELRALPGGRTAMLNTYTCGFYLLDKLDTDAPTVTRVHAMWTPRRNGCSVPVLMGKFWVMPVAYSRTVVTLDLSDPAHPIEVSALASDSTFLPHWASADPNSNRVVITGQDDGEPRVMIANLDPVTGKLTWDERFRDAGSARAGVSFARETWPHGTVPHAMPHGALFAPGRAQR